MLPNTNWDLGSKFTAVSIATGIIKANRIAIVDRTVVAALVANRIAVVV